MDKVRIQPANLCKIRDAYKAISDFELHFQQTFGLGLNEGMLLCSLSRETYSSGEIADLLSLTHSNASKVIKAAETKGLVRRIMGTADKRQMYFALTLKGQQTLLRIKCEEVEMPQHLRAFLDRRK